MQGSHSPYIVLNGKRCTSFHKSCAYIHPDVTINIGTSEGLVKSGVTLLQFEKVDIVMAIRRVKQAWQDMFPSKNNNKKKENE